MQWPITLHWHEIGGAQPVRGKAALAARFGGDGPPFDITAEPHDVVANDDHVVALVPAGFPGEAAPLGHHDVPGTRSTRSAWCETATTPCSPR